MADSPQITPQRAAVTVDLAGVCTGPGPCDTKPFGAGKSWVNKVGGLPAYIRAIAHSLVRDHGMDESRAISTAVATVKRWAAGADGVTAETRARAAAALAEWEAKKARAHSLTADATSTVDLAEPHPGQRYRHGWIPIAGVPGLTVEAHKKDGAAFPFAHSVRHDGDLIGVVRPNGSTFTASRKAGDAGDMRKVGDGFRSVDSAAKWVHRSKAQPPATPSKNTMNRMTNGTQWRETPGGIVAVRGSREVHLLGTSVAAHERAQRMLATHSFDRLFKAGKRAPGSKNVAYHKFSDLTADTATTVDLTWTEALHPRQGGKFAPKGTQTTGASSKSPLPPNMAANVRDFQKRNGLPVTGVIDQATAGKIRQLVTPKGPKGRKGKNTAKARARALAKQAAAARKNLGQHVATLNGLGPAQRGQARQRMPVPPTGYVWTSDNHLRAVPLTRAQKAAPLIGLP